MDEIRRLDGVLAAAFLDSQAPAEEAIQRLRQQQAAEGVHLAEPVEC